MMLRESEFSHRVADQILPLRDAFSVLFFVSVGMLFDPHILIDAPMQVLEVAAIILIGNPIIAMVLVLLFRYPLNTALTVGVGLAQIGEFSFILASMCVQMGLLSSEGQNLILAGALISIALNSFLFSSIDPALAWIRKRSALARRLEVRDDPLTALPMSVEEKFLSGQVVLVGYGRVGRRIGEALAMRNIPFVVAEQNREIVEQLRAKNIPAVSGDATDPVVLVQAHVTHAGMLVIATPDTFNVRKIIEIAKTLNPTIEIVLRTHSDEEAELLETEKVGKVFMAEHMLALSMTSHILGRMGIDETGKQQ
jgi:CPA2 family monovalent cation:H+ antiporter-2